MAQQDDSDDDYQQMGDNEEDEQEQQQQQNPSGKYSRENRLVDFQRLVLKLVSSRPDAFNAKNRKALTEDILQRITSSSDNENDDEEEDDSVHTAEACRAILAEWTGAYARTYL